MIYASRYLLVALLTLSGLAALYFLPIRRLLHYVWVYYQLAIVIAVVVVPVLYMLRVLVLKTIYAVAAQLPQSDKQAPAEAALVSNSPFPAPEPLV